MPLFTPWKNSPEYDQAKKIVIDASGRVRTVKADVARIVPKLNTYKKATLEKLLKEADANYAAALAKNQQYAPNKGGPEEKYLNALDTAAKKMKAELKRRYEAQLKAIDAEEKQCTADANSFRANGDGAGGGTQGIYARLCEQYDLLRKAYKKELAVAAGEKEPNPNRKV